MRSTWISHLPFTPRVSDVDNKINNALNRTSESTELQEQAKEAYVNGRDAEAVEMSDRALQSNPRNVLAHQVRGQALARLGRRVRGILPTLLSL